MLISLRYRSEIVCFATSYRTAFKLLCPTYRLCSTPYPSGIVTRFSRLLVNLPWRLRWRGLSLVLVIPAVYSDLWRFWRRSLVVACWILLTFWGVGRAESGCVWRYQMMLDFVILELTLSSKHFLPFVCQVSSRGCGFMTLTSWLGPVGGGEWVCWSWSWGCCCGFGRGWHMVEWVEGCG